MTYPPLSVSREGRIPALRSAQTPAWFWRLAKGFGAVFLSLPFVLAFVPWQQNVRGDGRAVAYAPLERQQVVEAPISGRVTRWYVAEGFPVGLVEARKVVLVLKTDAHDPVAFDRVKLASPGRADMVYRHALVGVPLRPLEGERKASFVHIYGATASCFDVDVDHVEWAWAKEEDAVQFPSCFELGAVRAALVWGW